MMSAMVAAVMPTMVAAVMPAMVAAVMSTMVSTVMPAVVATAMVSSTMRPRVGRVGCEAPHCDRDCGNAEETGESSGKTHEIRLLNQQVASRCG